MTHVTEATLAAAFTEWERRFREEPERFQSEVVRILRGVTPETYGEACAPYLLAILAEQKLEELERKYLEAQATGEVTLINSEAFVVPLEDPNDAIEALVEEYTHSGMVWITDLLHVFAARVLEVGGQQPGVPVEKVWAVVSYLRARGHDPAIGTNDTRWGYKRSADYIQNELLPEKPR